MIYYDMKAVIHAAMLGEKIDFYRKRVNITCLPTVQLFQK